MNYIPEKSIEEVRNASDIVAVISEVVLLKRAGKNFVGLCPFHSEKTPSFTVSSDKQIFYCFGCGAGGNVFTFLMKYEGFSFPEAVKVLGRRHGIRLEDHRLSPEDRQRMEEREGIFDVNEQAAAFFRKVLVEEREGQAAAAYLRNRGMTQDTIERFSLGYAPDRWDALTNWFADRRIPTALIEKSGLVIPKKSGGGVYDRFRNRIVFPIVGASSRIVGFGGRVMDDALPKYLNSPETVVFNKRRSLYGLEAARTHCRAAGIVYVVEGYFDVLSLSQAGIVNAVATLGTALSSEHVQLLKGYVREIVLVYDSDQAGVRAALKSVEVFRKENMDARILVLPRGQDPDSFIQEFGPDAFIQAAENARTMMDFMMVETVKRHGLSVEGKLRIVEEMAAPLRAVSDRLARSLYIRNLAEIIEVDEAVIAERIRQMSPAPTENHVHQNYVHQNYVHQNHVQMTRPGVVEPDDISAGGSGIEKKIVTMMLQFQEFLAEIDRRNILDLFENERLKAMGHQILMHYKTTGLHHVSGFIGKLDDTERTIMMNLAIDGDVWDSKGSIRLLDQFESSRKRRKDNLLKRIEDASRNNDKALLLQLLEEKQRRARKRQTIN